MRRARTSIVALGISGMVLAASCGANDLPDAEASTSNETMGQHQAARTIVRTVPAGTVVSIELLDSLASNTSVPGDRFRARLAKDLVADGGVAVHAGATVSGVVTESAGLGKIGGRPKLRLEFTELRLPGAQEADLHASYAATGKSETKKDAATIGGAAAGGAILGRIIGHQRGDDTKGTAIGGVVGAAAGTAIAASTKGQEIVLPSGHVLEIVLDEPIQVTLQG